MPIIGTNAKKINDIINKGNTSFTRISVLITEIKIIIDIAKNV